MSMSKLIEWAKKQTPKACREQMIKETLDAEHKKAYYENVKFCLKVNTDILANLLKQCPKDHLIVISRTNRTNNISFEESIKVLVGDINPDQDFRRDRVSCRVIINPANCQYAVSTATAIFGILGDSNDIINQWEFVPYPARWKKDAE